MIYLIYILCKLKINFIIREGVVQPCRIGDDGKPKPIEHVLELQEELPKQQYNHRDSDSD